MPTHPIAQTGGVTAAFMGFAGGSPVASASTHELIGFRWRLQPSTPGSGCTANIAIKDVQFM
jgi:hypothetical protein